MCDSSEPIREDLDRGGTVVVNTRQMTELLGRRRNRILVWSEPRDRNRGMSGYPSHDGTVAMTRSQCHKVLYRWGAQRSLIQAAMLSAGTGRVEAGAEESIR